MTSLAATSALTIDFDRSGIVDPVFARFAPPPAPLAVPPLSRDAREAAVRIWADRTRSEYVGVMIVRKLHGLLVDLNAPMDLQELSLQMLLDEQRHANLCSAVIEALGGNLGVTFDVPELQQSRTSASLEDQLLEMLVGTYACGEVVAHALVRHAIRALPKSGFRLTLQSIAKDEVLHARFGPTLLASIRAGVQGAWIDWPGDDVILARFEAQCRWMLSRDVVDDRELRLFGNLAYASELEAVGVSEPRAFKAAYVASVKRVRRDARKALTSPR
ncbi:MAG: hypothetical protein IV100_10070 [Myxococcales bacterium]|nr:hypothetical protein [Myxococcales bacterium]